ncbi:MAG: hypothetical protein MUF18_13050 [Fimbriiglobus sp.]|jgi:hypothetical protein|nr:hypothetical protein [Fimbriiglobus sp.]
MVSRRRLASLFAIMCLASQLIAQPVAKNPVAERLKSARLEPPEGVDNAKFNRMRNGETSLENPTPAERAVLEGKARQLVYPVTHFEYYTSPEDTRYELTPRTDDRTVAKLLNDLRNQSVFVTPGDLGIAAPKIDFAREFGAAVVKAVDEVLAKGPQPVVRMNAIRMLGIAAETGAPAAIDRVIRLLAEKDKGLAVEALYYGLKAAEQGIGAYDPARSAVGQKWFTRRLYFDLVSLVDDVVQRVPASVAEKTYQPENTASPRLTTDPTAKPAVALQQLTPEQVDTIQAFRLQAVRALGRVKTDSVVDDTGEKKRRTAYTLAKVAVRDTSIVPVPSVREVAEAVLGLANASPSDLEIDPVVLAVAMARGVASFVADKAVGGGDGKTQNMHWKITGTRLKAAFQAWDVAIAKNAKVKAEDKALLREFEQLVVSQVFDPLVKQSDNVVDSGLNAGEVTKWANTKAAALKSLQLYRDTDKGKDTGTSKLSPR